MCIYLFFFLNLKIIDFFIFFFVLVLFLQPNPPHRNVSVYLLNQEQRKQLPSLRARWKIFGLKLLIILQKSPECRPPRPTLFNLNLGRSFFLLSSLCLLRFVLNMKQQNSFSFFNFNLERGGAGKDHCRCSLKRNYRGKHPEFTHTNTHKKKN